MQPAENIKQHVHHTNPQNQMSTLYSPGGTLSKDEQATITRDEDATIRRYLLITISLYIPQESALILFTTEAMLLINTKYNIREFIPHSASTTGTLLKGKIPTRHQRWQYTTRDSLRSIRSCTFLVYNGSN